MADLIDRQAALEALDKQFAKTLKDFGYESFQEAEGKGAWFCDGITEAMCVIMDLPSAQPEQRWIPCSERLPEEGTEVLTYNHDDDYAINHIIDGEEWFFDGAVAWMPLPEPYKED